MRLLLAHSVHYSPFSGLAGSVAAVSVPDGGDTEAKFSKQSRKTALLDIMHYYYSHYSLAR